MPLTRKLASKSLIKQNTNQDVIGTGVTNLVRDAFTGTGSQTVFTLTTAPLSAANTQVFISGVYQNKNTYTVVGTTLTFSAAPPSSTLIEVISGTNYSIGVPGDNAVTNAKLAAAPAYTVKSNNTASSASPTDITIPQLAAMFTAPTVQRLTSGITYNTPANVKYIKVRMVGGGGGGGTSTGTGGAGGGGSGAYAEFYVFNPSSSYSISIGTGGGVATSGGNTTFGTNTCSGGSGGTTGNNAIGTQGGAGGAKPTISLGTEILTLAGGAGHSGFPSNSVGGVWTSPGGQNPFGFSRQQGTGAGSTQNSFGVGGMGGAGGSAGAAGSDGIIIVEEFYQ